MISGDFNPESYSKTDQHQSVINLNKSLKKYEGSTKDINAAESPTEKENAKEAMKNARQELEAAFAHVKEFPKSSFSKGDLWLIQKFQKDFNRENLAKMSNELDSIDDDASYSSQSSSESIKRPFDINANEDKFKNILDALGGDDDDDSGSNE